LDSGTTEERQKPKDKSQKQKAKNQKTKAKSPESPESLD
jgi:hypothetical protein